MKEVNIHYFVPENAQELEGLVEKPVGVKISSANSAEPMIFIDLSDRGIYGKTAIEYEFVTLSVERREYGEDIPLKKILGFKQFCDRVRFDKDGVSISGFENLRRYKPDCTEYFRLSQLLKDNNLWREPQWNSKIN